MRCRHSKVVRMSLVLAMSCTGFALPAFVSADQNRDLASAVARGYEARQLPQETPRLSPSSDRIGAAVPLRGVFNNNLATNHLSTSGRIETDPLTGRAVVHARCRNLLDQLDNIVRRQNAVLISGNWSQAQLAEITSNFGDAQASLSAMIDRCNKRYSGLGTVEVQKRSLRARPNLRD